MANICPGTAFPDTLQIIRLSAASTHTSLKAISEPTGFAALLLALLPLRAGPPLARETRLSVSSTASPIASFHQPPEYSVEEIAGNLHVLRRR